MVIDFLRGYIDGDGCLSKTTSGRLRIEVLGTEEFLTKVKELFPEFGKIMVDKRNSNVKRIICENNKADELSMRLYKNSNIYLDRKYEKFATLCKLHNSETSDKIGESCDANAEVTPEIAKGSESTVENSEWINIISPRVSDIWKDENLFRPLENVNLESYRIKSL